MVWEEFYVLGRGRHVYYRYIAMMWLRHDLIIGQFYIDGGRGRAFWIFLTRAVSGQVWVVHPLSMAASLCLKFILGGNTLLEWQTYTADLNNSSLLIWIKFLLLLISFWCHFIFYSLSLPPLVSFFVAFLMWPVLGSGHLKLGWGNLWSWVWQ